ncbi:MAG: HAD family hydrolase [archaeon]|nr:HAD family hydrolase [archaeon]
MTADYKLILFDLDNTLIFIDDVNNYFDQIIVDVFKEVDIEVPSIEQRNLLWRNHDFKSLLKEWNFPDSSKKFWNIFDDMDLKRRKILHTRNKIALYDDVLPILKHFKNNEYVFTSIITNTTKEITEFELKSFNLLEYFDEICALGGIIKDSAELTKPAPDGIFAIISRIEKKNSDKNLKFSKENVFIIGDMNSDIQAGINAGIKTIYINRKNKVIPTISTKPDYIINYLDEILAFIK